MSAPRDTVLLTGAYGLAGRAILEALLARTSVHVLAAGRDREKLRTLTGRFGQERLQTHVLDIFDANALASACAQADLVLNATGPYLKTGLPVARAAVEAGKPCLDFASEQAYYEALQNLEPRARERGVPLVTAAGAIPGLSGLLALYALDQLPESDTLEMVWAQGSMTAPEEGIGSLMTGALEAITSPRTVENGREVRVRLGSRRVTRELPAPFGRTGLLALPSIECPLLAGRRGLRTVHNWYAMGDVPFGFPALVRLLRPDRRPWSYRLLRRMMGQVARVEFDKARRGGMGPEGLLQVTVEGNGKRWSAWMRFPDGGFATAVLPAWLAGRLLHGEVTSGLHTAFDLAAPADVLEHLAGLGCTLETGPAD